MTYKIVTLNYTEQAQLVIKAKDNAEAEEVIWDEFSKIPDLQIINIEDADEDLVAELKAQREEEEIETPKVSN